MSAPGDDPYVWQLIFEQTPRALRWVFSVLTVGDLTQQVGFPDATWPTPPSPVEDL